MHDFHTQAVSEGMVWRTQRMDAQPTLIAVCAAIQTT